MKTVAELRDWLATKDSRAIIYIWGSVMDDGEGSISVNGEDFENY